MSGAWSDAPRSFMPLFVHSFKSVLFPLTCRAGRRSINAYFRSEKSPLVRAACAGLINLVNGWYALKCLPEYIKGRKKNRSEGHYRHCQRQSVQNVCHHKGLIQMEHLGEELFKVNKRVVFVPWAEPVSIPVSVLPCTHVPMAWAGWQKPVLVAHGCVSACVLRGW